MRMGEAIGEHRYRAVFVDLVGISSFGASSLRDLAYSKVEKPCKRCPSKLSTLLRTRRACWPKASRGAPRNGQEPWRRICEMAAMTSCVSFRHSQRES
jgi:hypothetical protein